MTHFMRDQITAAQRIGDECYLRTELSKAKARLGMDDRGKPGCLHRYRNSDGHMATDIYPVKHPDKEMRR